MNQTLPSLVLVLALVCLLPMSIHAQNCTPDTPCDDNDACTVNDTFDEDCNCIGDRQSLGVDTDGDGTDDCFDFCPNDPLKIFIGACGCGTPDTDTDGDLTPDCFDLCPNDPNKVLAGVCGCGNPDIDSDGDSIVDCIDLCPDSQDNVDSDGDGFCDDIDICPFGNDSIDTNNNGIPDACEGCNPVVGTACDDGDACTMNDRIVAECNCQGEFQDSDNDGVCDADDVCPGGDDTMDDNNDGIPNFCDNEGCNPAVGTPCNDGDICTISDVITSDCMCAGTSQDSDNDGVCDAQDICNGGNDNIDSDGDGIPDFCDDCDIVAGTLCDDGDACTMGDVYDENCNCQGTFMDSDGDGVCNAEDICAGGDDNTDSDGDGIPDFCDTDDCPFTLGSPCDDGDNCTENDAYDADCNCVGVYQDSDLDGFCDAEDTCIGGSDFIDENNNGTPDFCDECTTCNSTLEIACRNDVSITLAEGETTAEVAVAFPEFQLEDCPQCEIDSIENMVFLGTFEGHRYFVSEGRLDWYNAKEKAEILGGHLAVIDNARENHFLTMEINRWMDISSAFIGLQDIAAEGHLAWVNGQTFNYANWLRPLEEINDDNRNVARWLNIGKWDMEYELITRPFIVEIPCVDIRQLSGPTDNIYDIGTTEVRLQVKSLCGEEATCSYQVHVRDANSPLIAPSGDVLRFYALKKMEGVQLDWLTNLGFKTHHFVLEHSTNNESFTVLKNIVNLRFENNMVSHQTWDEAPQKGQNYYRLRQVFNDGSFVLSPVQKVVYGFDLDEFFVFPNPVREELNINLRGLEGATIEVNIFNALGHPIKLIQLEQIEKRVESLDVSDWVNGVYHLTLKVEGGKLETRRFVLQR